MSNVRRALALIVAATATLACAGDRAPTAPQGSAAAAHASVAAGRSDVGQAAPQSELRSEVVRMNAMRRASGDAVDSLRAAWMGAGSPSRMGGPPMLLCAPRRYDGDAQVIGAEGGVLRVGPHSLAIPAGALQEPTLITMEAPPSVALVVHFKPHGLQFAVEPTLTLGYRGCAVSATQPMRVVYVDARMRVLETPTAVAANPGEAAALIGHFSDYAVAW